MMAQHRARGFSLMELGIVLAVITILAVLVVGGAGYFKAARQRMAVDLVLTIRKAASQFALRHQKGLAYGVSINQNDPANVTMAGLRAQGFLPVNAATPWGDQNIQLSPWDQNSPLCTGFACIRIDMPVPAEECLEGYLVTSLSDQAIPGAVTCSGTTLTVIMR